MNAIPRTVRELVDRAARLYGDKTAYIQYTAEGEAQPFSFNTLKRDVDALGAQLKRLLKQGDHIGIMGVNSYMWITAYLAALCESYVAVPIPADTPAEALSKLVNTADVDIILADNMFAEAVKAVAPSKSFSECRALIDEAGDITPDLGSAPAPGQFSKIIFTSGTTGERRGVMLSQANMMCIAVSEFVDYAGDVSVSILPVSHAFESVCHVLVMLFTGGTLHLCSSVRAFPPCLAASGADSVYIVPALAEALLTRFRPYLDKAVKLKKLICGGAPVPQALVDEYDKLGIDVLTGYGLSECSPLVSLNMKKKPGSTGRVGSYCDVRIADDGEIQVKGENVMLGYYKNEAATRDAFTPDGWLKTGDLGSLDDENYLYLTGRIKNLIILPNGENVSPEEIETLVRDRVPGALDALCYADGLSICLTVFMGGDVDEQTLNRVKGDIAIINSEMPAYKRVAKLNLTAEPIPVSATGKKLRPA